MKIFPATESFFDESEWRSYHEVLVPELEALGLEVLDCSAGHVLPLVPLCDKLLDDDARTAIFPALGALTDAMCSRSISLCDRVLVMLDGDDDRAIIDQVYEAARQGKPMDGYLTDYRRLPWDEHDQTSREITALIVRSGGGDRLLARRVAARLRRPPRPRPGEGAAQARGSLGATGAFHARGLAGPQSGAPKHGCRRLIRNSTPTFLKAAPASGGGSFPPAMWLVLVIGSKLSLHRPARACFRTRRRT